jgi:hypothetical protein
MTYFSQTQRLARRPEILRMLLRHHSIHDRPMSKALSRVRQESVWQLARP